MKKIEELECFFCNILHFQTICIENFKVQKPAHIGIHLTKHQPMEAALQWCSSEKTF